MDNWRTPIALYEALDREFHFAVDVACESHNQLSPAGIRADEGADALLLPWESFGGAVWCNPPYSKIRPWLDRAVLAGKRVSVVVLVPADPSTRWWLECVASDAREVRFLVGRVRFRRPDGAVARSRPGGGDGLPKPSALVVYGPGGGPPSYCYRMSRDCSTPERQVPLFE